MNGILNGHEAPRLRHVICYDNGEVIAYDQAGNHMRDFEGKKVDVWPRVEAAFARDPTIVIQGASKPLNFREAISTQADST